MSKVEPADEKSVDRREFFRRCMGLGAKAGITGGALTGMMAVGNSQESPAGARGSLGMLRPPNAVDEDDFLAKCIRCTRCSDACEPQCIRYFESEDEHVLGTPYIMPTDRGCTMCLACGDACPTGAILPVERKEDVRIGVAVVDERLCVSHNGSGICGACHTVCPLKNRAITENYRNQPVVHADQCTGCGLCEEACIVDERDGLRAIQVHTHRKWERRTEEYRVPAADQG